MLVLSLIIYNFDELSEFRNVFEPKRNEVRKTFEEVSNDIFNLYGTLIKLKKPITFEFTENQNKRFLKTMDFIWNDIVETHTDAFLPNLNRHALILFRIAMILTVIRNKETISDNEKLVCNNRDFLIALKLTKRILRHSQTIFDSMDTGFLSVQDEDILDSLNVSFTREKIIEIGLSKQIPKRTIDDKLVQWQAKRIIKKIKRGNYQKL